MIQTKGHIRQTGFFDRRHKLRALEFVQRHRGHLAVNRDAERAVGVDGNLALQSAAVNRLYRVRRTALVAASASAKIRAKCFITKAPSL